MKVREAGSQGFSKQYWDTNYSDPEVMDGICNATQLAHALKLLFEIQCIDISSIVDLGFGLGHLLKAMIDAFTPHTVIGLEPSPHAYHQLDKAALTQVESTEIHLLHTDLLNWAIDKTPLYQGPFDLGICTSIFQYLSDREIEQAMPILAQRIKYLYFSVPTDIELDYQIQELNFCDPYAIRRSKTEYHDFLREYFTIVSNRVLESKVHFNKNNTYFYDLFYRF